MQIINTLDVEALHQEYVETGSVFIRNLLCDDVAEAAFASLKNRVPWEFHYRALKTNRVGIIDPQHFAGMTPREIQRLVPKMAQLKDNDFSFAYCRYTIPARLEETPEDTRILTEIYRYFNSDEYLQLMAQITGDDSGREVSTWASRYDRHHHLSIHMDESPGQGRIAAHVLGLSRAGTKTGRQLRVLQQTGQTRADRASKIQSAGDVQGATSAPCYPGQALCWHVPLQFVRVVQIKTGIFP